MQPIYSQTFFLSAGETDAEQEMSLPLLTSKIIDIATAHANSLGIGNPSMKEMNAGWVLSRVSIEMSEYPKVNDSYTLYTWIESFNRHFSQRCFRLDNAEGRTLGYARTVWMIMNMQTRENVGLAHLSVNPDFIFPDKCPIPRQERHRVIVAQGEPCKPNELKASAPTVSHTFRYTDLDAYRHVNTVRYVSLLLNQFSLEDFDLTRVKRLELSFLHEAQYGVPTELLRHDSSALDSAFFLRQAADASPILYARISRIPR